MPLPRLHIADKNYSSWSLRPWLALRCGGIAFDEIVHTLPDEGRGPLAFMSVSPTGRVPALELDGATLFESLAICEWAAEKVPSLWPDDEVARALARSAAALMHAGFAALRQEAPMNIRRRTDPGRMTPLGLADAAMMDAFWRGWLDRSGGPYLFGRWSIADAMYAPAATRFVTYALPRSSEAEAYIQTLFAEPNLAAWIDAAQKETRHLSRADVA